MPSSRTFQEESATRHEHAHPLVAVLVLILGLAGGLATLRGLMFIVQQRYQGRIYPNVQVLGVDLSGLTLDEARVALVQVADQADRGMLDLTDGEEQWKIPWVEAGLRFDLEATLETAYAVGHSPSDRHWRCWPRVWRGQHPLAPVFALNLDLAKVAFERMAPTLALPAGERSLQIEDDQLALVAGQAGRELDIEGCLEALAGAFRRSDPKPVRIAFRVVPPRDLDAPTLRGTLERLAPMVARSAVETSLRFEGEQVVLVEGQPGRELDVEASLESLIAAQRRHDERPVKLTFRAILPRKLDAAPLQPQVDELLMPQIEVATHDVLCDQSFSWTLGREEILSWLRLDPGDSDQAPSVQLDSAAVKATLATLAREMGAGRSFRMEEAADEIMAAHRQGGGLVTLYMTHAPGSYIVRPGDTAVKIAARHGMPLWTLTQANPEVDLNLLQVGQRVVIPTQDILTPYLPVPGKWIVVDLSEQHMRVYEEGALLHDWVVSTGRKGSPTYTGVFQVLVKEENSYARQWDLQMPHFLGVYAAGPDSINGIHALPILSNGSRLWAGNLGSPVSYGCIILGVQEAQTLYDWAEVGVVVVIEE